MLMSPNISDLIDRWIDDICRLATLVWTTGKEITLKLQQLLYSLFQHIISTHLDHWITELSNHYISTGLSWMFTMTLVFFIIITYLKVMAQVINWLVNLIFVKSGEASVKVIQHIISRVFRSIWC